MIWPYPLARAMKRFIYTRIDLALYTVTLPLPSSSPTTGNAASPNRVVFREIRPEDVDWLAQQLEAGAGNEDLAARLGQSRGVMAVVADRFAGYAWGTQSPREKEGIPPFQFPIRPAPSLLYIYGGYVAPGYRRKGVLGGLLRQLLVETARAGGVSGAFLLTAHPAVSAAADRLGFRRTGVLRYRRRLGFVSRDVSALAQVCQA